MVFFDAGTLGGYSTDRALVLAASRRESEVHLALYEPSWQETRVTLKLPFPATARTLPQRCQLRDGELSVDVQPGTPIEIRLVVGGGQSSGDPPRPAPK